ncbi:amino acid transporter AVT6C [Cajanus cajan]|uniref:Sodium-coupled neutral amino acid transporter 6 n=1 Tax=Cajanus cajan TaxID=3821 RepID=A0A151RQX6_CAJCA|nr:amino acid transporter AVT6C [Cajanus cajan]KYP44938.1 putative sodium-coupled neutral amino acid transporter 6 [Cajanus cajan]
MSPAAGLNVPLLGESKAAPAPASVPGAVFNVATSIVGAGIMSIPAIIKVLGVIPALVMILVVAVLAELSVDFLMRFTHSGETTTYAGVMREAFGSPGALAAQLCVIVTNVGGLILYLIIIGDVLSGKQNGGEVHLGLLQQWFGTHWWNSREFALFFTLVFVMLPLVLYRRVESLKYSSAVSTLLAVAFVGICCGLAISALVQGKTKTPRLFPKLDYQTSFFDLFTAVPVVVTAFTFHFNVHPIGFELAKPSQMTKAVRLALLLCAVIYITTGLFGYLLFGDSTQSDILINFDQNVDSTVGSLLNGLVRVSYALHIMLVFPLLNFSLRANIDEVLFPKKPQLATDNKRFVILTLVLLVFSYLAAIAIPDIWYFFQFLGSSSAVCLAFIFPGSIVLRDVHGISTRRDKIIALVMIILAVVTSVLAISTNIYNAFSSKS